ncbi:MAG TPA: hypothetical protein VER03_20035, partial [Bryobacteraceae bacterium]|nr:hypothetical protein [Bryobacteraceae bacterium]
PEIDEALRASVAKFFQAHVDGKYRQAEEVIAEDSKDFYYNMEKRRYFGFDIVRINYSDDFTKATVVTGVDVEWRSPRVGVMRVKQPMTSLWKVDNGRWAWYVVPQKDWDTPWGRMNPGPDPQENKMMALFKGVDVATVARQVAIDTTEIRLKGYEASGGQAVISNSMPGDIQLRLSAPSAPGLEVKLDKETLKSGEKATVSVQYNPATKEPKPSREIVVAVDPTGHVYHIALVFELQPEIQKLLPKELQK